MCTQMPGGCGDSDLTTMLKSTTIIITGMK